MQMLKHQHRDARRTHGFTLIELLVVISIIALLVGISVPVALKMLGSADTNKTRSTLNALAGALDEYKLQTGSVPDHTQVPGKSGVTNPVQYLNVSDEDTNANNNKDTTIGFFLSRVMQTGGVPEKMIRSALGKSQLKCDIAGYEEENIPSFEEVSKSGNATLIQDFLDLRNWEIIDTWDTPLRYAAKVSHDTSGGSFRDDDYLPAHPNPFFASAGPDGLWGDARALQKKLDGDSMTADEIEDADAAEDNIYSFELE